MIVFAHQAWFCERMGYPMKCHDVALGDKFCHFYRTYHCISFRLLTRLVGTQRVLRSGVMGTRSTGKLGEAAWWDKWLDTFPAVGACILSSGWRNDIIAFRICWGLPTLSISITMFRMLSKRPIPRAIWCPHSRRHVRHTESERSLLPPIFANCDFHSQT